MIGDATKLLKEVAKKGEISMDIALKMNGNKTGTHIDQFPLSLLIEGGYLGISITLAPPKDMEQMKELNTAISLHMFSLPRQSDSSTEYMGIISRGSIQPKNERIFMKVKGLLYLDEKTSKFRERMYSFAIGILVGLIAATFSAWVRGQFLP